MYRSSAFRSHANRTGKGMHRAVARYERFRDRFHHVLRCDIYRYFPAVDHEILKRDLRRRIACPRTLALADRIVDGSNPQEPVPFSCPAPTGERRRRSCMRGDDHRRQPPVRPALRIVGFRLHLSRPAPTARAASGS